MKLIYNTNDLGYKLISGQLKNNRKHSEQLNKYLAGLFDSDGCLSFRITNGRFTLQFQISQAAINDQDFEFMRAMQSYFNLGSCYYETTEKWSSCCRWKIYGKDIKIIFNRIGKHLYTKSKQVDNLLWLYDELRGVALTPTQEQDLRCLLISLKEDYGPLKEKKHPSWSYLAGLIHGDGNFLCRTDRINKKRNRGKDYTYISTELRLHIYSHINEKCVLYFIQKALGGTIRDNTKTNLSIYQRGLGKQNHKFAIKFLSKLKPYLMHPKKYETVERMLKFHKELAETKQYKDES